jgi:serine/threonine protein kinase
VPASTEKELYSQLENHKFRHIARCDVTDRKEIGSGEFGVVERALWQMVLNKINDYTRVNHDDIQYHFQSKGKIMVAVKTLTNQSEKDERVKFLQEAAINGQFHHRNVVKLHGVVTTGSPVTVFL